MSYKIIAEGGFICEYQCETSADLTSLPVSPACALGSRARIESSGDMYMLAIDNTWKPLSQILGVGENRISSTKIIEIQTHFPKNTAAGTEFTKVQIPKPTNPVLLYKASMSNSSIDSALTVKLFNRRTFHITGTAQAGSDATHIVLAATANPTNDHYNTFIITITAGTGIGQTRTISDYVGATVTAEVSAAWDVTPDATSVYSIALIRDCLAWTWNFAKASLTAPIVLANDSDLITGLFSGGCDVYYQVSNDTLIANADASRFSCVFVLEQVQ